MEKFKKNQDDLDLNKAFEIIVSNQHFNGPTHEIAELIQQNLLDTTSLKRIMDKHDIKKISDLKEEFLDLILEYINIILNDDLLTQKELYNVNLLKTVFHINEQDFYSYRHTAIKEVLHKQLMNIHRDDNKIDRDESLYKVGLQELFSISYDQFLEFANEEDFIALEKGADIRDLDTVVPRSKLKNKE